MKHTLLTAFALLTLAGIAAAHTNFEAVERRLQKAIEKGHITEHQMHLMMEALHQNEEREHDEREHDEHHERDHDEHKHDHAEGDVRAKFEAHISMVAEKIHSAVEEGDLSEEDAWKKWNSFKKEQVGAKLEHAIEEGMLTERDAKEIWHGIEARELHVKLHQAVEAGELSEDEARAKLEAFEHEHD